jgi:hypothetical protein
MPRGATVVAVVGRALLFLLLPTLSACAKDASASLAAITSWSATVRLAGESWAADLVPTPYTRRTLEAAEEGIGEAEKDLAKAADLSPAARDTLLKETAELRRAVSAARQAVARKDRGALTASLAHLAARERRLRARESGGGGEAGGR